jgi:hypothetical protein
MVGAVALPYLLTISYNINFKMLNSPSYRSKFGGGYSDLDISKRASLIRPLIFSTRRIVFVVATFFLQGKSLLQLILMIHISLLSTGYLLNFKPFE